MLVATAVVVVGGLLVEVVVDYGKNGIEMGQESSDFNSNNNTNRKEFQKDKRKNMYMEKIKEKKWENMGKTLRRKRDTEGGGKGGRGLGGE